MIWILCPLFFFRIYNVGSLYFFCVFQSFALVQLITIIYFFIMCILQGLGRI
jgi:hypothetical protein